MGSWPHTSPLPLGVSVGSRFHTALLLLHRACDTSYAYDDDLSSSSHLSLVYLPLAYPTLVYFSLAYPTLVYLPLAYSTLAYPTLVYRTYLSRSSSFASLASSSRVSGAASYAQRTDRYVCGGSGGGVGGREGARRGG